MKKNHLISQLTSVGLIAILLVLTGFSIWTALTTRQATENTIVAEYLSDQYGQARFAIGTEESLERLDRPTSFPEPPAGNTAAAAFATALHNVARRGDAHDRSVVAQVLAIHQLYLLAIHQMFAAADKGAIAIATNLDNNKVYPAFNSMRNQVNIEAINDHIQSIHYLAELAATEQMVLVSTLITFPMSLILLASLLLIVHTYQRRIDEGIRTEMARLARTALTDNLTNLGNHRAYQQDLHRLLASGSDQEQNLALAIIDIDELKMINDISGYLEGDHVLTSLATILRNERLSSFIYRLNGGEFAMILPHMTLLEAAPTMERLRSIVEKGLFGATVSIGIASSLPDGRESDILQAQVHLAVSEAKRRSHNTVVTFEDIRESVSLIPPAKVHALHRLLNERQINVAFQPIWDIKQNHALAFEALARPSMDYGFSGPQEAFDIAEKIGRAHELDYLCVHSILARAAELPSDALLFLNLTPQTLEHDVLTAAILLEAVLSAGLTPDRVVLEITERSVIRLDVVVREAKKLRTLGFRLALDDTGAGNAGLEMLSQLPVDFVKIDRSIVVKALTDATVRTIFSAITTMAQQMNCYVIAEGIEDISMLNLVQQVGTQAVQGYLVGRPDQVMPDAQDLQALSPSAQRAYLGRLTPAL